MLNKLGLENIISGKLAAGIEVVLLSDGSHEINLVILKKEKSTLVAEQQRLGIKNVAELSGLILPKTPIILLLNGKGIIHKKVTITDNDTDTTLISKVFPNANVNEFNIQRTYINPSQAFISLIRKELLDKVIDEFKINNLTAIYQCFLGPFTINHLLPIINERLIDNEQLSIGNYQLQIREQQITDITIVESKSDLFPILIGMDNVPQKLVLAFAGAFSYFVGNLKGVGDSATINYLAEEVKQRQKFEFRAMVLLVTTFIVLTVNYIIFNYYWNKSNELSPQLTQNEASLKQYAFLKKEYEQKKILLETNGLLENSRTSYYADRITSDMPSSILLTEMNVHPLKKKKANEEREGFFFETKTITISGKSKQSTELNNWMKELKKKDWIEQVTLVNYKQESEKDNGLFLIELKLN
jgi:Tfp pilus assembly protein PilN